jgi:hypothetical protein
MDQTTWGILFSGITISFACCVQALFSTGHSQPMDSFHWISFCYYWIADTQAPASITKSDR